MRRKVAGLYMRLHRRPKQRRIGTKTLRIGKREIPVDGAALRHLRVGRRRRQTGLIVVDSADRTVWHTRAHYVDCGAMGEVHMVYGAMQFVGV